MKTIKIPLTQGKFAIIDAEDYPLVMNYKFYWHLNKNKLYVHANIYNSLGIRTTKSLHRFIMSINDPKIHVDHINGNPLDNRKCNLRLCGRHQNNRNKKMSKNNKSGYKGVIWIKNSNKWMSYIYHNKMIYLGLFKDKEEAALKYNKAAKKYFGEFAKLNIIKENNNATYRT